MRLAKAYLAKLTRATAKAGGRGSGGCGGRLSGLPRGLNRKFFPLASFIRNERHWVDRVARVVKNCLEFLR